MSSCSPQDILSPSPSLKNRFFKWGRITWSHCIDTYFLLNWRSQLLPSSVSSSPLVPFSQQQSFKLDGSPGCSKVSRQEAVVAKFFTVARSLSMTSVDQWKNCQQGSSHKINAQKGNWSIHTIKKMQIYGIKKMFQGLLRCLPCILCTPGGIKLNTGAGNVA